MLNPAFALIPSLGPDRRDAEEGFLGKLILWGQRQIRYRRALHELQRLDDRNLADIGLVRADIGRFVRAAAWPGVPPRADPTRAGTGVLVGRALGLRAA